MERLDKNVSHNSNFINCNEKKHTLFHFRAVTSARSAHCVTNSAHNYFLLYVTPSVTFSFLQSVTILAMSHKENCYAHSNNVTSVRHAAPRPRCLQPRHCCTQTSLAHASNSLTHAQAWAKMTARRLVPAEESPNTAFSFRSVRVFKIGEHY